MKVTQPDGTIVDAKEVRIASVENPYQSMYVPIQVDANRGDMIAVLRGEARMFIVPLTLRERQIKAVREATGWCSESVAAKAVDAVLAVKP